MTAKDCPEDASHDARDTNAASQAQSGEDDNMSPCLPDGRCCDNKSCCDESCSTALTCCDCEVERCDEKCILAVAAFECGRTCGSGALESQDTDGLQRAKSGDYHNASACSAHIAKAFDKYSDYLESARCICRSVLGRGWPSSCCGDKLQQSARLPGALTDNDDDPRVKASRHRHQSHIHNAHHHHHHHDHYNHHGACLNIVHGHAIQPGVAYKSTCSSKDTCCGGHEDEDGHGLDGKHADWVTMDGTARTPGVDLEKATNLDLVVLSVVGMTCSGCGNKLQRTLEGFPGVSSVRVNFVMSSAEFKIDTSISSLDQVVRGTEKTTGFRCTRVSTADQSIDLLVSGTSAKALMDLPLLGVSQVAVVNKKIVSITYDATVIGARDLVQQVSSLSCGLAPPRDDPAISNSKKRLFDQLIKTLIATSFTMPIVVMAWSENLVNRYIEACLCLAFATVVQLIAVPVFYHPALSALWHSQTLEMDMLVVISITAAYVYSVVAFIFIMAGKNRNMETYFETSSLLITLVLLGRLVAAFARIRAVEAVSLRSLQVNKATIIQDDTDVEIDARLLQYGDVLRIGTHSTVPTDAMVLEGWSEVDESMLTGESVPVMKKKDDMVIAGTVNGSGVLVARLTRLPGDNTVTDIAQLVEEAAQSKPRLQDIADRIASWFVPFVSFVTVIVVVVWMIVGIKGRGYNGGKAISAAITYAVATLAVSCPCALGLAVPMVLVVAGGIAARNGVIIKSAECTERARKITDVVFDKTGTITESELEVTNEELFGSDEQEIVAIAKCLVASNKHPVSLAVAKHLEGRQVAPAKLSDIQVIPGAGVEAVQGTDTFRAGNPLWTDTSSHQGVVRLQQMGRTILVITRNSEAVAVFGLLTRIRPEAAFVVHNLVARGIRVHLVSGDQMGAVASVAGQVGIFNVAAQCTPSDKREYVASLMATPKRPRIVMFVGDGTNDAVAVTQADVGVQLASVSSASHVTRSAADVVLLNGLEGILVLLRISAVAFRRMAFNFIWAAVYNFTALLFASGAMVKMRIPPAYAGLGEIVSVLPVIGAAVSMLLLTVRNKAIKRRPAEPVERENANTSTVSEGVVG